MAPKNPNRPQWCDLTPAQRLIVYQAILNIEVLIPGDESDWDKQVAKTAALQILSRAAGDSMSFTWDSKINQWVYFEVPSV